MSWASILAGTRYADHVGAVDQVDGRGVEDLVRVARRRSVVGGLALDAAGPVGAPVRPQPPRTR